MTNREKIIALLDSVPDYKMGYVLAYVQGITAGEENPNQTTLAAMDAAVSETDFKVNQNRNT
ncbi:MAG: hypothetical protein UEP78_09085 [Negativibacillus sp.]|nr:hypothetical protein [Negativibacillus sp.]